MSHPRVSGGILIGAIHGILTGTMDASWCDAFDAWCRQKDPTARVLRKEYMAGPIPAWNVWYRNPRLARSLVAEVEEFMERGGGAVYLVAHSNGCDVALKVARLLIANGTPVRGMVLTSGACQEDVKRSGVLRWAADGMLGRAIARSSKNDVVLRSKAIWPYGRLGYTGWTIEGAEFIDTSGIIRTVWINDGHNTFLTRLRFDKTFEWIWEQLGL